MPAGSATHATQLKGSTISRCPRRAKSGLKNIFLPASAAGAAVSVATTAEHITGERSSAAKMPAAAQRAIRLKTGMDVPGFLRRTANQIMPQETTKHTVVLEALKNIEAVADLAATNEGLFEYEVDLEVVVYGRNYNGKKVGPYVRLLTYSPGEEIIHEGEWGGNAFYFVVNGRAEVYIQGEGGETKVAYVPAGAQFGEMSLLAGGAHASTVRAPRGETVQVLEVRRPALRLLRKLSQFSEALDIAYRRYGRAITLQDLGAATNLSDEAIKPLEAVSQFRVYSKRHVLFRAGEPIERIYALKSGWLRLSHDAQLPNTGAEEFLNLDESRGKMAGESYF